MISEKSETAHIKEETYITSPDGIGTRMRTSILRGMRTIIVDGLLMPELSTRGFYCVIEVAVT